MYNKYEIKYNPRKLKCFYSSLSFTGFQCLKKERIPELDLLVLKNKCYFSIDTTNMASLATSSAIKLLENKVSYGLLNDDEVMYFFIKMIDPELKFLEAYECVMEKNELINTCLLNFGYYDNVMIYAERIYNQLFKKIELDDLLIRDSIKRIRIKPKND